MIFTKIALKDIKKIPKHIHQKLYFWIDSIKALGLSEARKQPGFNDEALLGKRAGQRSVRLSKGYRAIYRELPCEHTLLIEILEVNKHDY